MRRDVRRCKPGCRLDNSYGGLTLLYAVLGTLYIIFDVESALILATPIFIPWPLQTISFLIIFTIILTNGIIYEWLEWSLNWKKPRQTCFCSQRLFYSSSVIWRYFRCNAYIQHNTHILSFHYNGVFSSVRGAATRQKKTNELWLPWLRTCGNSLANRLYPVLIPADTIPPDKIPISRTTS